MADPYAWKSATVLLDSATTSGTVTEALIAAVTGKHIRVKAVFLGNDLAALTAFSFLDGSGGSILCGSHDLADTEKLTLPPVPAEESAMWFQTSKGTALWVTYTNGGTAAGLGGVIVYTEAF
jgi:hypothetical protein